MSPSSISLRKAVLAAHELQATVPRCFPTQYRVKRLDIKERCAVWGVMKYMIDLTPAQSLMYPHGVPLGFIPINT